jgi:hypothetical protein
VDTTNYWGNEVNVIALEQNAPAWAEALASSVEADVTFDSDYYADGRPPSRHSYHTQHFIESLNRAVMVGCGSRSKSGNPGTMFDGFNPDSNTFDAPRHFCIPTLHSSRWCVASSEAPHYRGPLHLGRE